MVSRQVSTVFTLFILACSCVAVDSANALEVVAAVINESDYTSNTLRSDDNEISEWIHKPGADLLLTQDSSNLLLNANYSVIRRYYQKDIWNDETIATGGGSARWFVVPRRLDFFATNSRRESTVRSLQAETQANRQIVTINQIGSTLTFRPRGRDTVRFEYTYDDTQSNGTRTNSNRHKGALNYNFGLSASSSLNFSASYSDIEYSGPFPTANFTITTIGYSRSAGSLQMDVNVGYNWYDRGSRGKTSNGTYSAIMSWRINSGASVTLDAFNGIVDRSNNLTSTEGSISENTGINAAFEETRGRLTYTQVLGNSNLTLGANWAQQKYAEDVPLDVDRYGFNLILARNITRRTSVRFDARYTNRDFIDQGDEQDQIRVNFLVSHDIGNALNLSWGVRYEKRDSLISLNYEEVVYTLGLRYTFLGSR